MQIRNPYDIEQLVRKARIGNETNSFLYRLFDAYGARCTDWRVAPAFYNYMCKLDGKEHVDEQLLNVWNTHPEFMGVSPPED